MKLTIGYLYYDLMNLYGEIGNIKILEYHLKEQGIEPIIKKVSINDEINFSEFDLIYIGSGTEENRDIVLKDLLKYKKEIQEYIENNKYILATGNAYPLFGESIINKDNEKEVSLQIFNYYEIKTDRIVEDVVIKNPSIKKDIYGFYNHFNEVIYNDKPLFDKEGYKYKNFYGTYLLGPILSRNPNFLVQFIKDLITSKKSNFKFSKIDIHLDNEAYEEFVIFKKTKKHIK